MANPRPDDAAGLAAISDQAERLEWLEQEAAAAAELRETLRERMGELEQLHRELTAVRLDLELKDAFALELKTVAQAGDEEAHRLRLEVQELERSLAEANGAVAELNRAHAEALDARQRAEGEIVAMRSRAGYRLVLKASALVGRLGPIATCVRWVARVLGSSR